MTTPSEQRTRRAPKPVSEMEQVRRDIVKLLRDIRGAFDELLVQSEIGEMNVRDAVATRMEQIDQAWFSLKRCIREQTEEEPVRGAASGRPSSRDDGSDASAAAV